MLNSSLFVFKKCFGDGLDIFCEEAIIIPLDQPFKWLCARLMLSHNIPKYIEAEFSSALYAFIEEEAKRYYDDKIGQLYETLLPDNASVDSIVSFFQAAIEERSSNRYQTAACTDEEIFGQAYTKIVQSPAAMDLIQLEHSFAVAVNTEVIERDRALNEFQRRIVAETQELIDKGTGAASDLADAVSELQYRFHIEYEVARTKWNSRISDLKELQRRDYRSFVMSIEEQMLHSNPLPVNTENNSTLQTTDARQIQPSTNNSKVRLLSKREYPDGANSSPKKQEVHSESFNVQLGRQLRTSYNLKLVQADPMDLMTTMGATSLSLSSKLSPTSVNLAERLGSALTIYSNELTGLIILVDRYLLQSKDQKRLAEVCERSTDFHFPELDRQLADIQDTIDGFVSTEHNNAADHIASAGAGDAQKQRECQLPEPGDVYITRHTNLASAIGGVAGGGGGVGVVFHVVLGEEKEEDRLRCLSPLYSALSAVLRVCFQYDITTLAIPLLLTRRLVQHTTANWCYHRAEAVFKAVKGSLMELATLRGQVLRNILFLVPPQLPDSASFDAFSHLLASSFQQPNPLIASTNT